MLNLEPGDRIELSYEDSPATTIRATVRRLLTPQGEAMGEEVEDYIAGGLEITLDGSGDTHVLELACFARHGFPVSARWPPGNYS